MHRAARGRGHGPAQLAAGQTRLNHESRSSHRPAVSPWASHLSCPNRASVCSPGNTGTEASRRADVSSEAANERNQDPNPGFPSCKASTILAHQKRGQHRRGGHEPARPVPSSHPASPAPGPDALRTLRLHADTSRPKATVTARVVTAAAIFPQLRPEAETASARTLCVDAQGPARELRPARQPALSSSGPRPGGGHGLGGCGELRDQAVGPAGARERRGGRGAQVRGRSAVPQRGRLRAETFPAALSPARGAGGVRPPLELDCRLPGGPTRFGALEKPFLFGLDPPTPDLSVLGLN